MEHVSKVQTGPVRISAHLFRLRDDVRMLYREDQYRDIVGTYRAVLRAHAKRRAVPLAEAMLQLSKMADGPEELALFAAAFVDEALNQAESRG